MNMILNREEMTTVLKGGRIANGIFAQYYSFAGDVEETFDPADETLWTPAFPVNEHVNEYGDRAAEIVAFILGAALLYRLGRDGTSKPGFAPVMLDEGFIKADSRFTSRAISAWQGFGFQLIIAVPEEKYQSVVSKAERVLNIVADESRRSYVSTLDLVGES